jgi:hypothetical protein
MTGKTIPQYRFPENTGALAKREASPAKDVNLELQTKARAAAMTRPSCHA